MIENAVLRSAGGEFWGGGPPGGSGLGTAVRWELIGGTEVEKGVAERFYIPDASNSHLSLTDGLYIVEAYVQSHGIWTPAVEPDDKEFRATSYLWLDDGWTGVGV